MQEYNHQKARVEARIGHKRKDGLLTRVAANIIMRAGYRNALTRSGPGLPRQGDMHVDL